MFSWVLAMALALKATVKRQYAAGPASSISMDTSSRPSASGPRFGATTGSTSITLISANATISKISSSSRFGSNDVFT